MNHKYLKNAGLVLLGLFVGVFLTACGGGGGSGATA